jgi:hypothetical protein
MSTTRYKIYNDLQGVPDARGFLGHCKCQKDADEMLLSYAKTHEGRRLYLDIITYPEGSYAMPTITEMVYLVKDGQLT